MSTLQDRHQENIPRSKIIIQKKGDKLSDRFLVVQIFRVYVRACDITIMQLQMQTDERKSRGEIDRAREINGRGMKRARRESN